MGDAVTALCVAADGGSTAATLRGTDEAISVTSADSIAAARERCEGRDDPFDAVVARYELQDGTAVDLFEALRETAPDITCVLYDDPGVADLDFTGAPVFEYVPTTSDAAELALTVAAAVRSRRQRSYPIPADEDERLTAVDDTNIEDAGTVEALSRLATIAANALDAPIAFVGLVDDHCERFLATHGVDGIETMDRSDTACTHTIARDGPMTVPNLQTDPRFESVAAYAELGVKAYAGVPIKTPEGRTIGTLCVVDTVVREFTDNHRSVLSGLAAEATDQLALRGATRSEPAD